MNYEQLSLIAKNMDGDLKAFPPDFYRELAAYITEMNNELQDTEPDAPDHQILNDELKTVQKFSDKIVLMRVCKILELAGRCSLNGLNVDTSTMMAEEYNLYNGVKASVERYKTELLCDDVDVHGDYTQIRPTMDINTFSGPDGREYELKKDVIATIPDSIANVLVGRHVAVLA